MAKAAVDFALLPSVVASGRNRLNNCESGVSNDATDCVTFATLPRMATSAVFSCDTETAAACADVPNV